MAKRTRTWNSDTATVDEIARLMGEFQHGPKLTSMIRNCLLRAGRTPGNALREFPETSWHVSDDGTVMLQKITTGRLEFDTTAPGRERKLVLRLSGELPPAEVLEQAITKSRQWDKDSEE